MNNSAYLSTEKAVNFTYVLFYIKKLFINQRALTYDFHFILIQIFQDFYFLQILELTVCAILSKKASTKINPNEHKENSARDHEESIEIDSFDGDL